MHYGKNNHKPVSAVDKCIGQMATTHAALTALSLQRICYVLDREGKKTEHEVIMR